MRKKPRRVRGASKKLELPLVPGEYRLVEEGTVPLPDDAPELQRIRDEIIRIVEEKKGSVARWLKRQVTKSRNAPLPSKESQAIALQNAHPGWSVAQIAKKLGVSRGSAYRWKSFMRLRGLQEDEARETAKIPSGFIRRSPDGIADVEAVFDPPDDD